MVHVRTHHPISMYIAGKSKAVESGDRLIVLGWKSNEKTGRKAHSARCFPIPQWQPELTGKDADFVEMLVDAVEQRQKLAAHSWITEQLDINNGVCNDIPASMLEPRTILSQFLDEQENDESRGKLSAAQIGVWFNEKLASLVMMTIATKKGWLEDSYQMTVEQEKQVEQATNGYRAVLERLASPKPVVTIEMATQLKKAVELLPEADRCMDVVARKLDRKLVSIINPPAEKQISLMDL
jgi:hypothetical protein